MGIRNLKHYGRLAQQRRDAHAAAQHLRPEQAAYYEHLLRSWGARVKGQCMPIRLTPTHTWASIMGLSGQSSPLPMEG